MSSLRLALELSLRNQSDSSDKKLEEEKYCNMVVGNGKIKKKRQRKELNVSMTSVSHHPTPHQGPSTHTHTMKRKRPDITTKIVTTSSTTVESTNIKREIFAPPWLRILLGRLERIAATLVIRDTEIAKVIVKENGMHVVQLPSRNPAVSNQYVIEPVSAFAMNVKNFVSSISWSCLKSPEAVDLYYSNMQEAEANSRPAQCIQALNYVLNAIIVSKSIPRLVDGRPLCFAMSSLYPELRKAKKCLGVECCITCRRVDWTLRNHPFISGIFFCPVCLISYLSSTSVFNSLRKLKDVEEEEEEDENKTEKIFACICCGRSTDINLEQSRVHAGASCGVLSCSTCSTSWCDPCLFHLGGGKEWNEAYFNRKWKCFVCRAEQTGSPCKSKRLIQIATDQTKWNGSILRMRPRISRACKDLQRELVKRCVETNRTNRSKLIDLETTFGSEAQGNLTVLSLCKSHNIWY
jgi:hypothetical protein